MATLQKVEDLGGYLAKALINFADSGGDTIRLHCSNTLPSSETSDPTQDGNGILGNVSTVSTNLNVPLTVARGTNTQTNGAYAVVMQDATISASGGAGSQFRYIYVYNDSMTSPVDGLIGYYDYGSALDLADGESLEVDFGDNGAGNGTLLTVT